MDQNFKHKVKLSVFVLSLMMVTACSSSKVEEGDAAAPPETVGDASPVQASTDAVPAGDPAVAPPAEDPAAVAGTSPGKSPDSLAANPEAAMPAAEPSVVGSNEPSLDTSMEAAPVTEATPITDAAPAAGSEVATIADPAPVSDSSPMVAEPSAKKKKHQKKKGTGFVASNSHQSQPGAPGEGVQYSVKNGDTLMKIAFEQYGDLYRWKEIYEANHDRIQDPNHVPPGTQLSLNGAGMVKIEHNGEQYLIKQHDTLGTISKDVYGTPRKWKRLWENNRDLIKDPNKIYAGFYLFYQPEGRLTHDQDKQQNAPAVVEGSDSAAVTKAPAPRTPASK